MRSDSGWLEENSGRNMQPFVKHISMVGESKDVLHLRRIVQPLENIFAWKVALDRVEINFDKLGVSNSIDNILSPREIFSALPERHGKSEYLRDVQSEVTDK